MKTRVLLLTIFATMILGCSANGFSSNGKDNTKIVPNDNFSKIKQTITEKIEKGEIPSLTVAVFENGKITWMESFGYADKENKIEATPNTLYSIASTSKPMTATGIMKLVEQGKIDLDMNVESYLDTIKLKNYSNSSDKVTCRNLLSHTSGLAMHFQYYYDDNNIPIPAVSQAIQQYGIIVNPPSSKYVYANMGYGILGEVISRTSGMSFIDYMEKEIFSPLEMTQTTFDISSETKHRLAKRYDILGNLLPFSFCDTPGAGNASSTIQDLIKFGKFHLENYTEANPLLSTKTLQTMHKGQYPDNSNQRNTYGLGWFINDTDYKYKMVHHAGGMDGVDVMVRLIPEKNIVVAAVSNQYTEFTHKLTEDILLEMLPDLKAVDSKQTKATTPPNETEKIEKVDLIGSWEGHIMANGKEIPIDLEFQEDGDIQVNMYAQFDSMIFQSHRYKVLHKMLLNVWSSSNGKIMGWYNENIPGDHLTRSPQFTILKIEYKDGKLVGTADATASNLTRMHYGISHFVEFEKVEKSR